MADVIAVLEAGSEVQLVNEDPVNGFYNVITADGREGYCMCDYISILECEEESKGILVF